jgi:hypothetical protein
MKYRIDVLALHETSWATNALRFDTPEAAEAYGRDLYSRWTMVDKMSVVPDDVPDRQPYVEGERTLLFG